jgi:Flp pilus assembly pilin Flp
MVQVFTITENISEYVGILVKEFFLSEEGATAIEYALMAALIGSTVIGAQTAMGRTVVTMYETAVNTIIGAMGS